MKICYGCKKELDDSRFNKNRNNCKDCQSIYNKQFHSNNPRKEYKKKNYQENREAILADKKIWYQNNKESVAEKRKPYRIKNRQKIYQNTKEWKKQNREQIRIVHNQYCKERRETDNLFMLASRLRTRLWHALEVKGWKKNTHFSGYIGCTYDELVNHIEKKFSEGMTWENKDLWHVDHIIPLISAETEEEMYKLCHYTNLQPLWETDNLSKNDTIMIDNKRVKYSRMK
jgi:hypothetical protein